MIREASPGDAVAIAAIYAHYVEHSTATFEQEPPGADEIRRRMRDGSGAALPWLVHERAGEALAYAYAAPWSARPAYRFAVETTVYVRRDTTRSGIGGPLYAALLERLAGLRLHRAVGVIALPNPASVALHERLGFRKVGHLTEMGWKLGRWIDVGWWLRELGTGPPAAGAETS